LDQPVRPNPGSPEKVNAAFAGKAISFGSLRSISLTIHAPANSIPTLTRVLLGVKLDGESRFIDASFALAATKASSSVDLLTLSHPAELQVLEQLLMEHRLYYSQQIWLRENAQNIIMQFAPLTLDIAGKRINLVDYLAPVPVTVVGNYLVYRFTFEDDPE